MRGTEIASPSTKADVDSRWYNRFTIECVLLWNPRSVYTFNFLHYLEFYLGKILFLVAAKSLCTQIFHFIAGQYLTQINSKLSNKFDVQTPLQTTVDAAASAAAYPLFPFRLGGFSISSLSFLLVSLCEWAVVGSSSSRYTNTYPTQGKRKKPHPHVRTYTRAGRAWVRVPIGDKKMVKAATIASTRVGSRNSHLNRF